MPANCGKLKDGRHICPECAKTSVMEEAEMLSVAREVRIKMKNKLNLGTDHDILFKYTDMEDLARKSPSKQDGMELGLYLFEEITEKTVTTRSTISGGKYARKKIDNWSSKIQEIAPTFKQLEKDILDNNLEIDPDRPSIEFYRSFGELICMLPVK